MAIFVKPSLVTSVKSCARRTFSADILSVHRKKVHHEHSPIFFKKYEEVEFMDIKIQFKIDWYVVSIFCHPIRLSAYLDNEYYLVVSTRSDSLAVAAVSGMCSSI